MRRRMLTELLRLAVGEGEALDQRFERIKERILVQPNTPEELDALQVGSFFFFFFFFFSFCCVVNFFFSFNCLSELFLLWILIALPVIRDHVMPACTDRPAFGCRPT